jgi:hypothetical protein
MAVNGTTPQYFYIRPTQTVVVHDLCLVIRDSGTWTDNVFCGQGTALTNGITMEKRLKASPFTVDETYFSPSFKANADLYQTHAGIEFMDQWGATKILRWHHQYYNGNIEPMVLHPHDEIRLCVQDDLTGITSFRGHIMTETEHD